LATSPTGTEFHWPGGFAPLSREESPSPMSIVASRNHFGGRRSEPMEPHAANKNGNSVARSRTALLTPALATDDRRTLERWARGRTTPQRLVLRSRIVLLLGAGISAREAARRLGVARHTVALWWSRFAEGGCVALTRDKPGRGRKRLQDSSTE
jgi:hypothetical protein